MKTHPVTHQESILAAILLGMLVIIGTIAFQGNVQRAAILTPELDALPVTQVLQKVIDSNRSTKTSVNDLLATLDFDTILQSMTQDEFLDTLTRYGQTPGYTTRMALKSVLSSRGVDLTNLKPYGIFQALAYPPKAPSLLKYDDTNPWEIPQKRYSDLETRFLANRADFMEVFTTERLLTLMADAIAPANGGTKTFYAFSSLRAPGTYPNIMFDEELEEINDVTDSVLQTKATQLKTVLNARPAGLRSVKVQGVERVEVSPNPYGNMFPVLREANGTPAVDSANCVKDESNGDGVYLYSLWLDDPATGYDWVKTVSTRLDRFFQEYKRQGGLIDLAASDLEEDWWWWDTARCIWVNGKQNLILNDPRWPALRQELFDAGLTQSDLDQMPNWPTDMKKDDWRRAMWDAVMTRRQIAAFNAAMYAPVKKWYPSIRFVEYEYFRKSALIPYGNYRKYPRPISMQDALLGTHQSVALYGLAQPINSPTRPNSNAIDAPTDRKNPTFYEKLISDVNHMRTMSMSASDPIFPWIQHPSWSQDVTQLPEVEEWYYERFYHTAVTNVDDLLFWIYSGLEYDLKSDGQEAWYKRGYDVVQQALSDINARMGYTDRRALPSEWVDYQAPYVLSGMEVHGKRLYRFTSNPAVPTLVQSNGTSVELWSNGALVKTIPNASFTQSHKGYWIVQTATDRILKDSISNIMAQISTASSASSSLHEAANPLSVLLPAQTENGCVTQQIYTNLGITAQFPSYSTMSPLTLDRNIQFNVPAGFYIKYLAYGGLLNHIFSVKLTDATGQSLGWYVFSKDKNGDAYRYDTVLSDKRAVGIYFKQGNIFEGVNIFSVTMCPLA